MHEVRASLSIEEFRRAENLILESEGFENWNLYENFEDKGYWIQGFFDGRAEADAGLEKLKCQLRIEGEWILGEVVDEDWKDSYKDHFKPWSIGGLHWAPLWLKDEYELPPGHEAVWLDPGMAFGTGNHETTRLCVERLLEYKERGGGSESSRIADAGCGSGILAISAAKLGFRLVHGFDIDADAVRIANENAALNGVNRVAFNIGGLEDNLGRHAADCLMANILSDVLIRQSDVLADAVAPKGWLILSGILASEATRVADHFVASGIWDDAAIHERGEWASVTLIRD